MHSLIASSLKTGKKETVSGLCRSEQEKSLMCVVHDITERKQSEPDETRLCGNGQPRLAHSCSPPFKWSIHFCLQALMANSQTTEKERRRCPGLRAIRLITLVNDLLDLERMESGRMDLSIESIPLSDIIKPSINMVANAVKQRKSS